MAYCNGKQPSTASWTTAADPVDGRTGKELWTVKLGGAAEAARRAGVTRTVPYGWIRRGYVSSRILENLKAASPELDLNAYFEVVA